MESYFNVAFMPQDLKDPHPYQQQLSNKLEDLEIKFYALDFNPLFLFELLEKKIKVLHLHWLHVFLVKSNLFKSLISIFIFVFQILILRLLGIKIIWTVHNLKNHESKNLFLDWFGSMLVAKLSHAIIAHCNCAKDDIVIYFGLKNTDKVLVVPHGNFSDYYKNDISKLESRKRLKINESEFVILFLGLIRSYKGIPELIDAFEKVQEDNIRLLIAGKLYQQEVELIQLLEEKAKKNIQISLMPGYVSDDEIQIYMNAADVVAFPYRSILTSGSVLLAMSFRRPCIAPKIGCMGEVLDEQGSFLYDPTSELGLLNCLEKAIQNHSDLLQMGEHNFKLAENYNWQCIAQTTFEIYQGCFNK